MVSIKNALITAGAAAIMAGGYCSAPDSAFGPVPKAIGSVSSVPSLCPQDRSLDEVISRINSHDVPGLDGKKASPGMVRDFVKSVLPSHPYSVDPSIQLLSPENYDKIVQPGIEGDFLKSFARTNCLLTEGDSPYFETFIKTGDARSALFYSCVEIGHMVYRSHPLRRKGPAAGFFESGGDPSREELFCWMIAESFRDGARGLRARDPMEGAIKLAVSKAGSLSSAAKILYEGDPESCDRIMQSGLYLSFKNAQSKGLLIPSEFEGKTVPEALLVGSLHSLDGGQLEKLSAGNDLQSSVRSIVGRVSGYAIPVDRIRVGRVDPSSWVRFLEKKGLPDLGGFTCRDSFDGDDIYFDVVVNRLSYGEDLRRALFAVGARISPVVKQDDSLPAAFGFLSACGYGRKTQGR